MIKRLKSKKIIKPNKRQLIVVLSVVLVGLVFFAVSDASVLTSSIEVEDATSTDGNSKIVIDSSASKGKAVEFGTLKESDIKNFFPLLTYVSPEWDFAKWKSRGINAVLDAPQGTPQASWAQKANAAGLKIIGQPGVGTQAGVIGWSHPDEPDGIFQQVPWQTIQQNYSQWKSQNPDLIVWITFIGKFNQYDLVTKEGGKAWYQKYIAGADWIAADNYPVNEGLNLSAVGTMVDTLRDYSGEKPTFAWIETSDYNTSNSFPGPSPAQLRAQIWSAIIHGVRGIGYFAPRVVPDFVFDATPPDVAAEMTKQNALVTSLAPALQQGAINPSGMGATVPAGFEVGWRNHSSGKYFFVLNLTNTTKNNQSITLNGIGSTTSAVVHQENRTVPISGGKISDNFEPYGIHIYKVQ